MQIKIWTPIASPLVGEGDFATWVEIKQATQVNEQHLAQVVSNHGQTFIVHLNTGCIIGRDMGVAQSVVLKHTPEQLARRSKNLITRQKNAKQMERRAFFEMLQAGS